MGARVRRARHALRVAGVARQTGLRRVLAEIGVVGDRPATADAAREFRLYVDVRQHCQQGPAALPAEAGAGQTAPSSTPYRSSCVPLPPTAPGGVGSGGRAV